MAKVNNIEMQPISTISEYCLIREILWMFTMPSDCKFFAIHDDTITVKNNVSLNSVTLV